MPNTSDHYTMWDTEPTELVLTSTELWPETIAFIDRYGASTRRWAESKR